MAAIQMVNAKQPTERSRHIDISYFAIQDWKEALGIKLVHCPGILNPADDLTNLSVGFFTPVMHVELWGTTRELRLYYGILFFIYIYISIHVYPLVKSVLPL